MSQKKKIKGIKDNPGDGTSITIGDPNPPKSGVANPDITFDQPYYKSLCFNVGDIINVNLITPAGAKDPVVVTAARIQGGTVLTTQDDTGGTIAENRTKKTINFYQTNLKDLGIDVGSAVKYDLVADLIKGGEMAVNVVIDPNG